MSRKALVLTAIFCAATASCIAQSTDEVFSQNKEANTYYIKADDYIKIGNHMSIEGKIKL